MSSQSLKANVAAVLLIASASASHAIAQEIPACVATLPDGSIDQGPCQGMIWLNVPLRQLTFSGQHKLLEKRVSGSTVQAHPWKSKEPVTITVSHIPYHNDWHITCLSDETMYIHGSLVGHVPGQHLTAECLPKTALVLHAPTQSFENIPAPWPPAGNAP